MSAFAPCDKVHKSGTRTSRKKRVSTTIASDSSKLITTRGSLDSEDAYILANCFSGSASNPKDLPCSVKEVSVDFNTNGTDYCHLSSVGFQNIVSKASCGQSQISISSSNFTFTSQNKHHSDIPSKNNQILQDTFPFSSKSVDSIFPSDQTSDDQFLEDVQWIAADGGNDVELTITDQQEMKNDVFSSNDSNSKIEHENTTDLFKRAYKKFLELTPFINSLTGNTFPELFMGNGQTILRDTELMMIFEVESECPVRHFEHDVVTVSGVSMQEHSLLPLFIVTHLRQIAVHVFGKEVNNFKLSPCSRRWMADRVKILKENRDDIPLDEFYNLLYNSDKPEDKVRIPADGLRLDRKVTAKSKLEGLKICQLVLQAFQRPSTFSFPMFRPFFQNEALFSLNFEDILRTFLSIKVILDMLEILEEPPVPKINAYLPRISIYKVYYILCKRLMQKYQTTPSAQNNIILSQANFGKVLKLSFPNLETKRLGRRGESKYHYYGVFWNPELIDSDICRLAELSLPDLSDHFKELERKKYKTLHHSLHVKRPTELCLNTSRKLYESHISERNPTKKPLYSFIHPFKAFPGSNCFLRSWEIDSGIFPQQSQWSKETMIKAVNKLKFYGFDVDFLLNNYYTSSLSQKHMEEFIEKLYHILTTLIEFSAPVDFSLSFYLVICLLISPVAFASNKEVSLIVKDIFQNTWNKFVERIEAAVCKLPPSNRSHLMSFTKIIRKMICCNKLLTSQVPTMLVKDITSVMGTDDKNATNDTKVTTEREAVMMKIISKCTITTCNALSWEFVDENLRSSERYRVWFIEKFKNSYVKFCKDLLENIFRIPQSMTSEDWEEMSYALPYRIFASSVEYFHSIFLSDDFISKLPIKLIELVVINITNEFQTINFHRFGQLDHELSKEIFKTWWVYSTAVQESMTLACEVISLSLLVNS